MKRTIISLLIAVVCAVNLSAQNSNSDIIYFVNGKIVENFDGSQLVGKTIQKYVIEKNIHLIFTTDYKKVKSVIVKSAEAEGESAKKTSGKTSVENIKADKNSIVYVLDGKVVSYSKFKNMDPSQIKTIEVLKDPDSKAFKKYFEDAKKLGVKDPRGIIIMRTK